MGVAILLADLLTSPFLAFPILFVLPVSLCGWFCSARMAYTLAVLLPACRFLIAAFVERPFPFAYIFINALIRLAVLLFLAFLVVRNARQTKELQQRVTGLVTMCAWSRTIKHQGEWISFEQYLKLQFGINTSHGISSAAAQKFRHDIESMERKAEPGNAPNDGPATPLGNSRSKKGPPSVS